MKIAVLVFVEVDGVKPKPEVAREYEQAARVAVAAALRDKLASGLTHRERGRQAVAFHGLPYIEPTMRAAEISSGPFCFEIEAPAVD